MKVIIAGSRHVESTEVVGLAVWLAGERKGITVAEVVSGCARGVDKLGETWAIANRIPVKKFPADWGKYGKGAGSLRNEAMANYGDALIAIWDGISSGTLDMIRQAKSRGLVVFIYRVMKPSAKRKLLGEAA